MSPQNSSNNLEQRFHELKEAMSSSEWKDPDYLTKVSKDYETTDPELYLRILQRVKYLNRLKLKQLNKKIKKQSKLIDEGIKEKKTENETNNKDDVNKSKPAREESSTFKTKTLVTEVKDFKKEKASDKGGKFNAINIIRKPIVLFVVVPWIIFALYQVIIASPRYESQAKVIVKQPDAMATMDTGLAVLSGLGMAPTNTDTQLVIEYILSIDMLNYIDEQIQLKEHYESDVADFVSRLSTNSSQEDFLQYYNDHVKVEVDDKSQVISIYTQAFTPEYSKKLNQIIVKRAEWFINEVNRNLAAEQLKFIQKEHDLVESKLARAQKELLEYQNKYSLLDPEMESAAMQRITYSIEAKIAEKKSELNVLSEILSDQAPQVTSLKNQIRALEEQLVNERSRLSSSNGEPSVSQIISKFADYKINVELALQAYTSSLISLEKSRVESYRQIKFLVTIENPTTPEDSSYPKVLYNLSLFAVVLLMLFGIGAIIRATIKELT